MCMWKVWDDDKGGCQYVGTMGCEELLKFCMSTKNAPANFSAGYKNLVQILFRSTRDDKFNLCQQKYELSVVDRLRKFMILLWKIHNGDWLLSMQSLTKTTGSSVAVLVCREDVALQIEELFYSMLRRSAEVGRNNGPRNNNKILTFVRS